MLYNEHQTNELNKRAISPETANRFGVISAIRKEDIPEGYPDYWKDLLPGLLFPWTNKQGRIEYQFKPDNPSNEKYKYLFRSKEQGFKPLLWAARETGGTLVLVEGTHQTIAVATYADKDYSVYGMSGCWGWRHDKLPISDLQVAEGREVIVIMDADISTNRNVWDAAKALQDALLMEGATDVKWVKLPAGKNKGIDDLLGARDE